MTTLADVLDKYVEKTKYKPDQLAQLSGLPKATIINWLEGRVAKPQKWQDLLKLLAVLHLTEAETNEVLRSAGQPVLNVLRGLSLNVNEQPLLSNWPETDSSLNQPATPSPFQAPPEPHYFIERKVEKREDPQHFFEEEIRKFGDCPIIGLTGLGGVGKTALATHLAHQLKDQFADGILWAQMDATRPAAVLRNFAATFGQAQAVAEASDMSEKAAIVRQILANKEILIVLDNVEESEEIRWLIPSGKRNVTLITTRNQKLLVNLGAKSFELRPLNAIEGLELLKRVTRAENRISAEEEEAKRIIKLVGGLPLALNITAGYLAEAPDLTIAEYAAELEKEEQRLDELKDWEDQANRNVEAAFLLSYRRLEQFGQTLFASLAVFNGPDFSSEAVAAVMQIPPIKAKRELGRLRMLSLVEAGFGEREYSLSSQPADLTRYRQHSLLKLFAKRQASSELSAFQQRAATHFAKFAEDKGYLKGYETLDLDWENIMGVLKWADEHQEWDILLQGVQGLTQLDPGIIGFMDVRGYWQEAREILGWTLAGRATLNDELKAMLHAKAGTFAYRQGEAKVAEEHFNASWTLLAQVPASSQRRLQRAYLYEFSAGLQKDHETKLDWLEQGLRALDELETEEARYQKGYMYIGQAQILGEMGALERAIQLTETGLGLLPKSPTSVRVNGLINLINFYYRQGNFAEVKETIEAGLKIAEALNDLPNLAVLYELKGTLAEKYSDTLKNYEQALKIYQRLGNVSYQCLLHSNLGLFHGRLDHPTQALWHFEQALDLARENRLSAPEAVTKINLARLYIDQGQFIEALPAAQEAAHLCLERKLIYDLPEALSLQAEIALAEQDLELALTLAEKALQAAQDSHFSLAEGRSLRVKANTLSALGYAEQAEQTYSESERILAAQDQYELALTKLELARHHYNNGHVTAAIQKAKEALAIFESLEAKREIASAKKLLAQISPDF